MSKPQAVDYKKVGLLSLVLVFWAGVCAKQMNHSPTPSQDAASVEAPGSSAQAPAPGPQLIQESVAATHPSMPVENTGPVKNVILMIGDGMGVQQVGQAVIYRQLRKAGDPELALEKMMKGHASGLTRTTSYGDIVTDSAAAATAIACGMKVLNETVGLDPNGYPCETILEKAEKMGKATGLVSTTRITHATPASFAGHQVFRDMENELAEDMIERHDIDVLLSGGIANFIPQYRDEVKKEPMKALDLEECVGLKPEIDGKSKREDQKNLIAAAKSKGMTFVCRSEQLDRISLAPDTKVLGLFSASVMPMIQERRSIASLPSLAQMTKASLALLDRKPKGFFLMVEGGLIDYAGHDNDAGTMLQETLDFDEAIQVAMDYVDRHPDTLLIVTADHETGGFGFSYGKKIEFELALPSGLAYHKPYDFAAFTKYDYLIKQKKSFRAILEPITKKLYPKEPAEKPYTMNAAVKDLTAAIQKESSYSISEEEARRILHREPGAKDASPHDFPEFYVHSSIHPNILGRAVSDQNHAVWASGTHTATPILTMARGPSRYADRVKGFIDNTDIYKIIEDALNNR
ncbi:MAG TPA: alkaline phosphatase [bacterium]|nr:alkaline phosphatase [bacterium]